MKNAMSNRSHVCTHDACFEVPRDKGRRPTGLIAMKRNTKSILSSVALFTLLALSPIPILGQTLITFDDISFPPNNNMLTITNGFFGLNWVNFFTVNVPSHTSQFGTNRANYGMLSAPNVAFNGFATPAEIDSPNTHFNFLSAYLTVYGIATSTSRSRDFVAAG